MWSAVENTRLPLTAPINSSLAQSEIVYFYCDDIMVLFNPISYFFARNVLRAPTIQRRVSISKENRTKKGFLHNFSQLSESLCRLLSRTLKKDPFRLNHTVQCGITLMMTLIGCFSESANVSLPFLLVVFEPITFSFFIPYITPYITCTRAHL